LALAASPLHRKVSKHAKLHEVTLAPMAQQEIGSPRACATFAELPTLRAFAVKLKQCCNDG
jgi:hypothetical protein